jgi:hypothetical protein
MSRGARFLGAVGKGSLWRFRTREDMGRAFRGVTAGPRAVFRPGLYYSVECVLFEVTPQVAEIVLRHDCEASGRAANVLRGLCRRRAGGRP